MLVKANQIRILRSAVAIALGGVVLLSLVHTYERVFVKYDAPPGLDFRLVWLAGKLWINGENPYSSSFAERYVEIFGPSINMYWSYPPAWLPISAVLSLASFDAAFRLWLLVGSALTIVGTLLVARAVASRRPAGPWLVFVAGLAFAFSMQATEIAIYIGQTSFVVYFGLAALIAGLLTSTPLLLILGLFVTALKPHVGLVAFVSILALPRYRRTTVAAGALLLFAAVGAGDILNTVKGFVANLAFYANPGNSANNPENLTGAINIVNALFDTPSSSLLSVLFTLVAAAGGFAALSFYRNAEVLGDYASKVSSLISFVAVTLLFVPLHAYDMVPLTIVLILGLFVESLWKWPILAATLLCNHPRIFATLTHIENPRSEGFSESLLISLMLLIILASSMAALAAARRPAFRPSRA